MFSKPIFFERNRVFRVYTGGKLFADFFGDEAIDGFYPEEWVASTVKAINKNSKSQHEGLSKIRNSDIYFCDLLSKYPHEMLGYKKDLGILTKLLDSAIRLPAQAHPDKSFSMKYFNSQYGKTESWLILDTRPGAKIYFGFKNGVTKEKFINTINSSLSNKDSMERLMCEIPVKKGDVFLIPARTVHAIGAGCLILEIQEPTDFTIQPEHWCGEYKLSDEEMYLGLSMEEALKCFDFENKIQAYITPEVIYEKDGVYYEKLIGEQDTDCFKINKAVVNKGEFILSKAPAVYVVTDGKGKIIGEGYNQNLKKGDYFFLPYCANNKYTVISDNIEIIEAFK